MDFNYQALALRTESPNYHLDGMSFEERQQMLAALARAVEACLNLDAFKKVLFYGQDLKGTHSYYKEKRFFPANVPPRIVHAIIGIMSEAGELGQDLLASWTGECDFDITNFKIELGDVRWYTAIGAAGAGVTLDYIDYTNINKLAVRFTERFTEGEALVRDLQAELAVMDDQPNTLQS